MTGQVWKHIRRGGFLEGLKFTILLTAGIFGSAALISFIMQWRDGPSVCLEWGTYTSVKNQMVGWRNERVLVEERICKKWREP